MENQTLHQKKQDALNVQKRQAYIEKKTEHLTFSMDYAATAEKTSQLQIENGALIASKKA